MMRVDDDDDPIGGGGIDLVHRLSGSGFCLAFVALMTRGNILDCYII